MKRFGWVTKARPEKVQEYLQLHADVWPGVLETIKQCNIGNYSIFLKTMPGGDHYLFSYMEYTGEDFDADMAKMAADEETVRWWAVCKPCLEPLEPLPPDDVWAPLDEVFHCD